MSDLMHPPEAESLGEYLGVTETAPDVHWLGERCTWCGRRHYMHVGVCGGCGVTEIEVPASERVEENCGKVYRCDGCAAYEEHLRG